MKKIVLLMPYFGKWPEWMNFYIKSCEYNNTIDFIFFTDCNIPENVPSNIKFHKMSFDQYKNIFAEKLHINTVDMKPYKICDYRPTFGYVHENIIKEYDFFGYGDIDVIYGDLRKFLDDKILNYDVISAHKDRLSGHFALFRNTKKYRNAFFNIDNWKEILERKAHVGLDEGAFSRLFRRRKNMSFLFKSIMWILSPYHRNIYFVEQYSTILSPMLWLDGAKEHPEEWYWDQGHLKNIKNGNREFMYLHFMNWKSTQWLSTNESYAKWELLESIVPNNNDDEYEKFTINETGFHIDESKNKHMKEL